MTLSTDSAHSPPPSTDGELLGMLQELRTAAVGFETSSKLIGDRQQALLYCKGEMNDLPVVDNRSKAISTDVNDAIETALPDLVEIFTGGDDVAAFRPVGPEDEEQAQQETDYILHVYFEDNPGFLNTYSIIKDALQQKVGIGYVIWEEKFEEEKFQNKTAAEVMQVQKTAEIIDLKPSKPDEDGNEEGQQQTPNEPLYSFTAKHDYSNARVLTVPPEDFSVSADTVSLKDSPYCCMRSRPRAQELIASGIDRKIVDKIPAYDLRADMTIAQARDTAQENQQRTMETAGDADMRNVEIVDHYVRMLSDDDEMEIWRIRTGGGETVLIDKQKVARIQFAAGSPYPVTHRFYGRSLADLLLEVQRIKTVLTRSTLDSAYFALNQRLIVAENGSNDFTISDVLNNVPGMPIRAKDVTAVAPVPSPGLGFDAFTALEYFSTVAESRTGIVRNAQGINPDTLHDTAKGAMALMVNAQKRLRLIARVLAETCFKDLFVLLHATLRENQTKERTVRLNNKWVPINPAQWAERDDMTIEVGLGASGRDHDLQGLNQIAGLQKEIGMSPYSQMITPKNIYQTASTIVRKLGFKNPERFFDDPTDKPPQPPPPDPHMAEVQGKLQIQQRGQQFDQQAQVTKMQSDKNMQDHKNAMDMLKAQNDAKIEREKNEAQIQLQREIAAQELQLKREQYAAELQLKRWEIEQELQLKAVGIAADTHVAMDRNAQVNVGGDPG